MVNDHQVRRLKKLLANNKTLKESAIQSGMDEKTARKYRDSSLLPSEIPVAHNWKTRVDPFCDHWDEIAEKLTQHPGLQAKTLFQFLQRTYPGIYQDGQLRTFQRRIKIWRATQGPQKEVIFAQHHPPGELSQSDFTNMNSLGITINHRQFDHLIYHFVLTHSNWETGSICFSESFESLSDGLQTALWELGGVPKEHQTDRLSAAVNNSCNASEFTDRYESLMKHYRINPRRINAGKANENGDVEQSHYRFKQSVEQELYLRGSTNFTSRGDYESFLRSIFGQRNAGRTKAFQKEQVLLGPLPRTKQDAFKEIKVRVTRQSTILINRKTYSVMSRLIGEEVRVLLHADYLELWYAGKRLETIQRLRGGKSYSIQYRHIIDSLLRKPGAFRNFKYQSDMYPSSHFKMVYDGFMERYSPKKAASEYLKVLNLAAKESEAGVEAILRDLVREQVQIIDSSVVQDRYFQSIPAFTTSTRPSVLIDCPRLEQYDTLLKKKESSYV